MIAGVEVRGPLTDGLDERSYDGVLNDGLMQKRLEVAVLICADSYALPDAGSIGHRREHLLARQNQFDRRARYLCSHSGKQQVRIAILAAERAADH